MYAQPVLECIGKSPIVDPDELNIRFSDGMQKSAVAEIETFALSVKEKNIPGLKLVFVYPLAPGLQRGAVRSEPVPVDTVNDMNKAAGVHALGRHAAGKVSDAHEFFRGFRDVFRRRGVRYRIVRLGRNCIGCIDDRHGTVGKLDFIAVGFFFENGQMRAGVERNLVIPGLVQDQGFCFRHGDYDPGPLRIEVLPPLVLRDINCFLLDPPFAVFLARDRYPVPVVALFKDLTSSPSKTWVTSADFGTGSS